MVLMVGRGEHCPRERQHEREMVEFYAWCAVAFTRLVTVLPNNQDDASNLRMDLQDLARRTKAGYHPTLPEVKAAWEHQQTATGRYR